MKYINELKAILEKGKTDSEICFCQLNELKFTNTWHAFALQKYIAITPMVTKNRRECLNYQQEQSVQPFCCKNILVLHIH